MTDAAADGYRQRPRLAHALGSLRDRRMAAMLILSFAASLPLGTVLGTLAAWLTEEGIGPAIIGNFSLVTLGYAFKYLWAPALQAPPNFPLLRIGTRRSWLLAFQVAIGILLVLLATADPQQNLALIAIIAFAVSLLSPSHDIVLDAWRIEVARDDVDKDLMSALYQFGYKSGTFITGFVALLLAARFGWPIVFLMIGSFVALTLIGTLIAPEPDAESTADRVSDSPKGYSERVGRQAAMVGLGISLVAWLIALGLIGQFLMSSLLLSGDMRGSTFVRQSGPWIVGLTVIVPAVVACLLLFRPQLLGGQDRDRVEGRQGVDLPPVAGVLFRGILDPLIDLVDRLRWGALVVLLLALTYRFTDAVWGSFAYPFYLGTDFGALGHSLDDVAIASKFFGVIATILGALLGGLMIAALGRMPVLVIGGIVAAATNLLYADLAAGAAVLDQFLSVTGLDGPLVLFADWAAKIQPETVVLPADQGQRMARLMITIFAENVAGGLALVAITAFLTSVVNPRFAAMQYALLASLSMLIGTLGRPWLGELIEQQGFFDVFVITFWLGGVAVVLCVLEWIRQGRGQTA
ncbi:MAG: MFS transporter [Pseudomonadota bacterium]